MKSFFTIRHKLITLTGGITTAVLAATGVSFYFFELQALREQKTVESKILVETIAKNAAATLLFDDKKSAEEVLSALRINPQFIIAEIRKPDNSVFVRLYATSEEQTLNNESNMLLQVPTPQNTSTDNSASVHFVDQSIVVSQGIILEGERLGSISIILSQQDIIGRINTFSSTLTLLITMGILLSVLAASRLQSIISRPIVHLAKIARKVSEQRDYSIRAEQLSNDETGDMISGFNSMLQEIEKRDSQLLQAQQELEKRVIERTQALSIEILERERIEQMLRREEAQLRSLIRNAPVAMAMLDERLCYLEHSARWISDYQIPQSSILGSLHYELFPDLSASTRDHLRAALGGEYKQLTEERFQLPNGQTAIVNLTIEPWYRPDGSQGGIFIVSINISTLVKARETAIRNAELKSQFLANLSHELRTPLNAILGFSTLMMDYDCLPPEVTDFNKTIQSSGQLLLSLINDVLDFSKIDSNKMLLESIKLSPRQIANEVSRLLSPTAREKGVSLKCEVASDLDEMLLGDPTRLLQVLLNLTGNAVKFTSIGTVSVSIRKLRSDEQNVTLRFEVADTGIGIPEDMTNRIFDAFTQADGSITRKFGGTGLGLAISSRLVEMMGGKIDLESSPGVGSVFGFNISLRKCSLRTESSPEVTVRKTGIIEEEGNCLNILIAEDNLVNQKLISALVSKSGYRVTLVSTGKEAVDAVAENEFDLVLMDLQMPIMGGLEAVSIIRSRETNDMHIPIVALTAHAFNEDRENALNAGMDDYLTKPIDRTKLIDTIKRLTQKLSVKTTSL